MFDDAKTRHQVTSPNGEAIDTDASSVGENDADVYVPDEFGRETSPDSGPPDSREAELNWIDEHVHDSPDLAGKWIVLHGARLVSSGLDLSAALDKAKKVGVNHPFVFRVPYGYENPISL